MRFALSARAVLAVALTALITISASSADWPRWRGPEGTGISDEKGLLSEWPEEGPKLLWRVDKALGRGFSGVAIAGERIFGMGNVDRKCHLIALSKKAGSRLWATPVGNGNPKSRHDSVPNKLINHTSLFADRFHHDIKVLI